MEHQLIEAASAASSVVTRPEETRPPSQETTLPSQENIQPILTPVDKSKMSQFLDLSKRSAIELAGQSKGRIIEVIEKGPSVVKGIFNYFHSSMPYKIVFLLLFFGVFYKVIYSICIFFGIDMVILNMYMGWVSFLLVLFTFLPYEYGNILDTPE